MVRFSNRKVIKMSKEFTPSTQQQSIFDKVRNSVESFIVEAVAGAGKTTTILRAIALMTGKVWFGCYNKKMQLEIDEKIENEYSELLEGNRVKNSTFHSLGLSIIKDNVGKNPKLDDKKVANILDEIGQLDSIGAIQISDFDEEEWNQIKPAVLSAVSMAKNRGFVDMDRASKKVSDLLFDAKDKKNWTDMFAQFDISDKIPEWIEEDEIARLAYVVLKRNNACTEVIDFDDMIYLPIATGMSTPKWALYDNVLVDEAQDTNPSRRALAKMILKRGGRFIAVGDRHQAIYGFVGADNDALQQIGKAFNADVLPLTFTYRCPKKIVELAQQFVSHIQAHESAPEGEVDSINYDALIEEIKGLDRAQYAENAILCRTNAPLVDLCFRLIREGVPAKIEGRSIGEGLIKLATRWKRIKTPHALADKLKDYKAREVKKAMDKDQEDRAGRIADQVDTLMTIVNSAIHKGCSTVEEIKHMIEDMFNDNISKDRGLITLCSSHKSKGLEWDNVFLLGREKFMPSPYAVQDWQLEQENNLIYVSITRAMKRFVDVTGVPTGEEEEQD